MNMLAKAIALASEVFKNTTDKGDKPYILHCLRVMNSVDQADEELMTIAVLHDVAEDFPEYTMRWFANNGFSDRVITALALLNHDKEKVSYDDYIKAIAHNSDARKVKLADLRDNTDVTRLKGIGKKDLDRTEKYHRAYLYLVRV